MDFVGLATLISSLTASFVAVVTLIRHGRLERAATDAKTASDIRDVKFKEMHDVINGTSKELKEALSAKNYAEGHAAGEKDERANPQTGKASA